MNPTAARPFWPLTAGRVAELTGGELLGAPEARAERVLTDSRSGVRPGDLFVGLRGPNFDGGRFAATALEEGAAVALVEREHRASLEDLESGRAAVLVDDALAALQALAGEARRHFPGRVVAITGSNGKTTVKDLLVAALGRETAVTASPQSYNSQVGVALSLLMLDPHAEVAIVECGISEVGEMARLEAMVQPDCGVFTNVGDAHLEGLGDRPTTAREKAGLFRRLPQDPSPDGHPRGWVVLPARETLARQALAALQPEPAGGAAATTSALVAYPGDPQDDPPAAFRVLEDGSVPRLVRALGPPAEVHLRLEAAPRPFLRDAALAAATALLLGAQSRAIEAGLQEWRPAPMRLELSTTPRGVLLINDAYTSDPTSAETALSALVRARGSGDPESSHRRGQTLAVLGGMAQLGVGRQEAHRRVGRRLAELGDDRLLDHLIVLGEGGAEIAAAAEHAGLAPERIHPADDVTDAAQVLEDLCRPGDRVLLKGSRPEGLERLAALLFDSVASARLYVDLDGVVENYRAVRRTAGPQCGVMAVVKSFGYGLGSIRVAQALQRAGVDAFAVAYPDEGVALRDGGISAPILVQNLLPHEVDKVVRYGLSAQISSTDQVRRLDREAAAQRRVVRCHLKLDTGMGRSGLGTDDLEAVVSLARAVDSAPWLSLEALMTHLAAAEDPAEDDFSARQLERFEGARRRLDEEGFRFRWVHAANSAALARLPASRYNLVRTGLALFGAYQPEDATLDTRPVLRLVTQVVSVKTLPPGHGVGYGRTYTTPENEPRTLAVVALGYGDGYPWALSNRGWMSIAGHRCPVVGRVSMDVTTLDVTAAGTPDRPVAPGDEVVIFGPADTEPDLQELADLAGTLPYELLTRLSPRVRRIFRSST